MSGKTLSVDTYTLLKDAYEGNGGFNTGDYLIQHKRENQPNYQLRQQIAYYLNYLQPVVNSHVNPVFRKNPARNWNGANKFWLEFVNNTDLFGSDMTQFMKQSGFLAKLFGVSFIVMDNFKEAQQARNQADAIKNRQFPYMYNVTPDRVAGYTLDSLNRLTSITYSEPLEDQNATPPTALEIAIQAASGKAQKGASTEVQYRTWTTTSWAVVNKGGDVLDQGEHNLGRVPVVPLFSKNVIPGIVVPDSEFFAIAKTNLRLYNMCSELDEILRNQAFSILTYPGKEVPALTIGVNNAIGYDGKEVHFPPQFIAPPAAPAEIIMSQMDRLINEMYRMAMLTHVAGGNKEARTGAAKAWDFEVTNQVLADFATNCERAEYGIAELFTAWTEPTRDIATKPIEYKCMYSSDFSIRDTEQELKEATMALKLNIGGKYDTAIKQHVAAVTLKDSPDVDLDEIKKDIEANSGKTAVTPTDDESGKTNQQEDTTKNGGGSPLPREDDEPPVT